MDVTNCRLIDAVTFFAYPYTLGGAETLCLYNMFAAGDFYQRFLAEFPDLTTPTFSAVYAHAQCFDSAKLAIASSQPWNAWASRNAPTALGPPPYIWLLKLMVVNRFIPHAAHLMRPLYEALRGSCPKDEVDWSQEMDKAFDGAKAALANATLLVHPPPAAPVNLTTDACSPQISSIWLAKTTWSRTASPGRLLGLCTWGTTMLPWQLKDVVFANANATLLCDVSTVPSYGACRLATPCF